MNKTAMWVVLAIIVIGVAAYFLTHKKASAPSTTSQPYGVQSSSQQAGSQQPAANSTATASSPQSLKDLIAAGGSQKCAFNQSGSQGTFYVGGGKARGDFSATTSGKTTAGHMVMDGKTSYIWMDGQAQGYKMDLSAAASAQASPTQSQGVDANKKMDYSCSSWTADSTLFSLPSGVQFVDVAAMMPKK